MRESAFRPSAEEEPHCETSSVTPQPQENRERRSENRAVATPDYPPFDPAVAAWIDEGNPNCQHY